MRAFMPRGNIESLELSFLTQVDHAVRFDLSKLANLPTVVVLSMYPVGMSSYAELMPLRPKYSVQYVEPFGLGCTLRKSRAT